MTPEKLPKSYEWRPVEGGSGGRLFARETKWADGARPDEHIASIWRNSNDTWRVLAWRIEEGSPGAFEAMSENVPTFNEAFNYLWTLIQLGEVHFTFRKDENERTEQGSS